MNIYLVRHGETNWNEIGKIQGHIDIELNEKGRFQAEILSKKLKEKKIQQIYCSDLARAYQTARIINHNMKVPIVKDQRLRERNYGTWQTLTWEQVHNNNPKIKQIWKNYPLKSKPPKGESIEEIINRVFNFFSEINTNIDKNILIIAHNTPLRLIIAKAKKLKMEQIFEIDHLSNTEIIHLTFSNQELCIDENEYAKLKNNRLNLNFQDKII